MTSAEKTTEWIDRAAFLVGWIYFLLFLLEPKLFGALPHSADPMPVSSFATILIVVSIAYFIQKSFWKRMDFLFRRSALIMKIGTFDEYQRQRRNKNVKTELAITAFTIALNIIGLYRHVTTWNDNWHLYVDIVLGLLLALSAHSPMSPRVKRGVWGSGVVKPFTG